MKKEQNYSTFILIIEQLAKLFNISYPFSTIDQYCSAIVKTLKNKEIKRIMMQNDTPEVFIFYLMQKGIH